MVNTGAHRYLAIKGRNGVAKGQSQVLSPALLAGRYFRDSAVSHGGQSCICSRDVSCALTFYKLLGKKAKQSHLRYFCANIRNFVRNRGTLSVVAQADPQRQLEWAAPRLVMAATRGGDPTGDPTDANQKTRDV